MFWNTCINGKTESKNKKMINTKVIWYLLLGKEGSVVIGKRFLGRPLGSSSQTIEDVGQNIPEEETASAKTCRQE